MKINYNAVLITATSVMGITGATLLSRSCHKQEREQYKQEVKNNVTPEHYAKLVQNEPIVESPTYYWYKNAKTVKDSLTAYNAAMRDSLRVDSIIKKAYFEGAQMVRDSIKAAAKTVK